jgi:hypothetical protein
MHAKLPNISNLANKRFGGLTYRKEKKMEADSKAYAK